MRNSIGGKEGLASSLDIEDVELVEMLTEIPKLAQHEQAALKQFGFDVDKAPDRRDSKRSKSMTKQEIIQKIQSLPDDAAFHELDARSRRFASKRRCKEG